MNQNNDGKFAQGIGDAGVVLGVIRPMDRRRVAEGLIHVISDTFTLALKCQSFAWNVSGPMSAALRPLFQEQSRDGWAAVEEIAVRIRFLGLPTPSAFGQFLTLSSIQEAADIPDWRAMAQQLLTDQDLIVRSCQRAYNIAELGNDTASQDLMARRISRHQRNSWELRSLTE
jgi:starvation-inducible DNA-binding protein